MMGGGAFVLLKAGQTGPKTGKQVEIRLANLLKILPIAGVGPEFLAEEPEMTWGWLCSKRFLRDMANLPESLTLLSRSHF
jgi:hypothetical protein